MGRPLGELRCVAVWGRGDCGFLPVEYGPAVDVRDLRQASRGLIARGLRDGFQHGDVGGGVAIGVAFG